MGVVDYQNTDQEQLMKRLRSAPQPMADEAAYSAHRQLPLSMDDLPRTVACTFHQGSSVTSFDFHPSHQTVVLVGSANGEITLWEVGSRERLVSKPFKIWEMAACSITTQASFVKDSSVSINRVTWSPDGNLMGIAYTKHLVHLYAFQGPNDLRPLAEIDAHGGGVNDLAFAHPNRQLCVISCGDDRLIKVWDLTGKKIYNFEGHDAPVYSVCPHHKETIQFIFSTATDGKIKAWLYDTMGSRVDYDAPGHGRTKMLYSADGVRLFSCGTSEDGESSLVEWNESEGAIRRTFLGFRAKSAGVVQFDTTQNRFLAAGEDHQIKFWDMNNINMLTSTEAEGGLPSLPRLKFNKEGNLLAVSTEESGFKILANTEGLRSLRALENRSFEGLRSQNGSSGIKIPVSSVAANAPKMEQPDRNSPARPLPVDNGVDPTTLTIEKPRNLEDSPDEGKSGGELAEIMDSSMCRAITVQDTADPTSKVSRLLYTNSGGGILVLGSNGVQKLWKWTRNDRNPNGKATANSVPQRVQPNSGLRMINDVTDINLEEAVPCIALSKNDSYVMSACGGKITLFNMMTFKVMTTFMSPPPAPTFLVFHPQDNNILAVGMEDSTIHIYNVRVDEVKTKLKGHQKRVTGLAFSTKLNILVSSGADAQLFTWNTDSWEKRKVTSIQLPGAKVASGDTRVQFHSDQIRLLVFHETQLAIYDASEMICIQQWVPHEVLSAPISYAAYSCNNQLIYAAFRDGNIGVFDDETLRLRCRIAPSAYLSQEVLDSQSGSPLVIATHPQEPNQFAIGLADGSVKVLEPLESDGKWLVTAAMENGAPNNGRTGTPSGTSNRGSEQPQR